MKLKNSTAEIFVPDETPAPAALRRITHLGIGAHQDDLEFMAFHGILTCYAQSRKWFGGVTCTNGAGSARAGVYQKFSDVQMMAVRRREQRNAAVVGRYGVMIQLDYPSAAVKSAANPALKNDLKKILAASGRKSFTRTTWRTSTTPTSAWPLRRCRPCANCPACNGPKGS